MATKVRTAQQETILAFLRDNPGSTAAEIQRRCGASFKAPQAAYNTLQTLYAKGEVRRGDMEWIGHSTTYRWWLAL